MANTMTIKSVTNNAYNVLSVKDGEDSSIVFSIDSVRSWNADLVVPWVSYQSEMHKRLFSKVFHATMLFMNFKITGIQVTKSR